jgi:hypothetical protein
LKFYENINNKEKLKKIIIFQQEVNLYQNIEQNNLENRSLELFQYKFRLNNNKKFKKYLRNLFEKNHLYDIDFTTFDGYHFNVNKSILSNYSEFFEKMFQSGFKESLENEINLTDIDKKTLGNIFSII